MITPKNCPECKNSLEGEDIFLEFLKEYKNEAKALQAAEYFGWSEENPINFSRCIGHYGYNEDFVEEWECPDCHHKWKAEYSDVDAD